MQDAALGESMAIGRDEVIHVARLARLGLTEAEIARFGEQLANILDQMAILNEVDVAAIPPSAQIVPLENVMRTDVVGPSLPRAAVLQNAPAAEDGYFRVPPVFEEES